MALSAEAKHVVHCVFCVSFILLVEIMSGAVPVLDAWWTRAVDENIGPFDRSVTHTHMFIIRRVTRWDKLPAHKMSRSRAS
jgi:hypothetical protein